MNFSTLCRSCMKDLKTEELEKFDENIADIFTFCTNIKVSEDIGLPKSFCSHCVNQTQSCYTFIRQAQEVNETLKNLISESADITYNDNDTENEFLDSKDGIKVECMINTVVSDTEFDNLDVACYTPVSVQIPEKRKRGRPRKNESIENCKTKIKAENMCQNQNLNKSKRNTIENSIQDEDSKTEPSGDTTQQCYKRITRKKQSQTKEKAEQGQLTENTNEVDKCPICLKIFSPDVRETWVKYHIRKCRQRERDVKNGIITYKPSKKRKFDTKKLKTCPKCFRAFLSDTWLKRHLEKEHTEVPQTLFCPFCPSSFDTYAKFHYHKHKHEESNKFQCNICNKKFRMRRHLFVHMITHADERPYTCDKCLMSFKMKHVLINHIKLHDNTKENLCSACGKSFSTKSTLAYHMKTHNDEKPLSCPQCEYRTRWKGCLERHVLVHQSELKYRCKICQKPFRHKTTLYRHQRLHTGEKPFKCPHCPQAFIDSWKRKMHLIRGHEYTLESIPKMNREGQSIVD